MSTTREALIMRPFVFNKVLFVTHNKHRLQQNYFITLFVVGHNFPETHFLCWVEMPKIVL